MLRYFRWSVPLFVLLLVACATPPEIKQLSVAQISYFDKAIKAIKIQSEALIIASEKIKEQAEERIESKEQEGLTRLENLNLTDLNLSSDERTKAIRTMLDQAANIRLTSFKARQKLAEDLEALKAKTEELTAYITKMKEVHMALDAYLQSEKAGESVVNKVLKHPSVSSLLDTVDELSLKTNNALISLKDLLNGMNKEDKS